MSPAEHSSACASAALAVARARAASPVLTGRRGGMIVLLAVIVLAGCAGGEPSGVEEKVEEGSASGAPPNIVLIVADDLGWGDLGVNGQTHIRTPNLDRLGREGTVFEAFYSGSTVCAPSRFALMTGHHMGRAWVRGNVGWPRGDLPLRPRDTTIADVLKEAGYATGAFGKWALGVANPVNERSLPDTTGAPHRQGFDAFFGYADQSEAHEYYVERLQQIEDGRTVDVHFDSVRYSHELIVERALSFIDRNREEPFFLYLPVTIPHASLALPDSSLAPYLDEEGESIFPETPYPGDGYAAQPMPHAAYAGMVSRLDRDVGRVVDRLRRHGLLGENRRTLLLFTSDNGPHAEGGYDPELFDSNGPFRGMKRDLYEGGIRVPTIAWGPGLVPEGRRVERPWAMWDLLPTFAELAGLSDADGESGGGSEGKGGAAVPVDIEGRSRADLLTGEDGGGEDASHARPLYWEFVRGDRFTQAVRRGRWKALRFVEASGASRTELYDLAEDPGEQQDLSDRHPERTARLRTLMDSLRTEPEYEPFRFPVIEGD